MLQSLVIQCPQRGPYRQYHPVVKVLAQTGCIPVEIKREIPASTWHDWRCRDHTQAIGSNLLSIVHQDSQVLTAYLSRTAFRKIVHAGYRLLLTIDAIVGQVRGSKKTIKRAKQRVVNLISRCSPALRLKTMTRAFGISTQTYYRWKRYIPCPSSLKNLCRRLHPAQLTKKEVSIVREALQVPKRQNWPLSALFYDMLRQGKAFMSLSTFYDYARVLGLSRSLPANRRKKHLVGIRTGKSGDLLQMDSMVFRPLDHLRVYIHLVT